MYISCNKLKKHIKNSDDIDWLSLWDKFTIRCAEVEGVTEKGKDLKDIVVVEITKCEQHPKVERYHILEVTDGNESYHILCGAPNVKVGLKCFMVKVGGTISGGIQINAKPIAGVVSEGMLCAGDELGINYNHEGIYELPKDTIVGKTIQEILPVEDIIVEIDNKSLTNRPDLWGHYGIAREVAAITKHELLPLPLLEIPNDNKDLDIKINNPKLCRRYCGLKLENLTNRESPMDMQIFLTYAGMRPISLFVDLTNYVMLEVGEPMHAFDSRIVKNIVVDNAKDGEEFATLDGNSRKLNKDVLLIKNNNANFGIAGIMGGLDSEIQKDTKSLFLESANFDATAIRKTATYLGLRTEASARYEKSLDPELCPVAAKRFAYLLKEYNPEMKFGSNLTDIYPTKLPNIEVTLTKEKLTTYMGFVMQDKEVVSILESLGFKVKTLKDKYVVSVPSYRATKDISLDADLIEEISRMYGYENIEPVPLKLDLTFKVHEHSYEDEYMVKNFLANRYTGHEVHSYLWYDSNFLKENDIKKENVTVVNKVDNNILRDDLSLSLLPFVTNNFKYYNDFILYEIGTVIIEGKNCRHLAIINADSISNLEKNYDEAKLMVTELFLKTKNFNVTFKESKCENYYNEKLSKGIYVNDKLIGNLNVVSAKVTNNMAKKKSIIVVEIDFDSYLKLDRKELVYMEPSKYQQTTLDYTIIMPTTLKYKDLESILNKYENEFLLNYSLVDTYNDEVNKKYTIRLNVGSNDKTLSGKELENIQNSFIDYIRNNNLSIVQ